MTIDNRFDKRLHTAGRKSVLQLRPSAGANDAPINLSYWQDARDRARQYLHAYGLESNDAEALVAAAVRVGVSQHTADSSESPTALVMEALYTNLIQTLIGRAGLRAAAPDAEQLARWRAFACLGGLSQCAPASKQVVSLTDDAAPLVVNEAPQLPVMPVMRRSALSPRSIERNALKWLWRRACRFLQTMRGLSGAQEA